MKMLQNVCLFAEECYGTMRESNFSLRNESDWSKK